MKWITYKSKGYTSGRGRVTLVSTIPLVVRSQLGGLEAGEEFEIKIRKVQ